jgi:hypothetical protein
MEITSRVRRAARLVGTVGTTGSSSLKRICYQRKRCGARIKTIDSISARGDLKDYHLLWAVRAHLLRRLGQRKGAAES